MMKRVAILVVIAMITLTAHGQTSPRREPRIASAIPTVNFCDFTVHPRRYAGKLVRVKATLVGWWESSYLYSPGCETDEKKFIMGWTAQANVSANASATPSIMQSNVSENRRNTIHTKRNSF
jgi:hypothetical protein